MTDYPHRSGLPGAYDRTTVHPNWERVVGIEDTFTQATDLNEAQSIIEARHRRVANLIARDGDRRSGCEIVIDTNGGTMLLHAGEIYALGDVRPVAERTLEIESFVGDIYVGVRLQTLNITGDDLPALRGLHAGAEAEGEDASARQAVTLQWALSIEAIEGEFIQVYIVRNGTPIDQTPPPNLTPLNRAIGDYDYGAHGNYIVSGCYVSAIGKNVGGEQEFSIEEGEANIYGMKRTRYHALRHAEPEVPDLGLVEAEPHVYADTGGGNYRFKVARGPIAEVHQVQITKRKTVTLLRGSPNNTADDLPDSSVTAIISVIQTPTTFTAVTDYTLSGDKVNWAPGGAEPAGGSSYSVTYDYVDVLMPGEFTVPTVDEIQVSGGVVGQPVIAQYDYKLPRIDALCLNEGGETVYLKGLSARTAPQPPPRHATLLKLCEITNNWRSTPEIRNNGTRHYPFDEIAGMYEALVGALSLIGLERLRRSVDTREPTAKKRVFVDPLTSDYYRDAGAVQTAFVGDGVLELAIDPTFYDVEMDGPIMLDWTEEVLFLQPRRSNCWKINPYIVVEPPVPPPPQITADVKLTPSQDFWVVRRETWLPPIFRVQVLRQGQARQSVTNNLVDESESLIRFLRPINIQFQITGFKSGEVATAMTFDSLNVLPGGLAAANPAGVINGSFTVPTNVVAGTKRVRVTGNQGSAAEANFVGQGTLEIAVMQRVTVRRRRPSNGGHDPLAQTISTIEDRHILGIDVQFCRKGDAANPIACELVNVEVGIPTIDAVGVAVVDPDDITLNAWHPFRFEWPVFRVKDRESAFVFRTGDKDHSLSVATLGARDLTTGQIIAAQPFFVGVLLSSSNARTWTPHNESDLMMRTIVALFGPTTKVVDLGSYDLAECSDLFVRGVVELPTADCSFHFEIHRPGAGGILKLQPDQVHEFTEYITETVQLKAVLTGTTKVSPTLYPGVMLVAGKIRTTGVYTTRLFNIGTGADFRSWLKTFLPAGSTLVAHVDSGINDWASVPQADTELLDDGWIEREYRKDPYSTPQGRLRLTLTGGPGARPLVQDVRTAAIG